jgi:hypothetical protein
VDDLDNRDRARRDLEDAVVRALEAGLTADEIGDEVEYAIETYEEDKDG